MWYKIDFRRLSVQLIPTFLRSPKMVAWANALVSPLEQVQDAFNQNRRENLTRLNHNGQVCYLRKILNDSFDPDRRIQILPPNNLRRLYIYTKAEYKPKYLGKIFIREKDEYSDGGVDFLVQIPSELEPYTEAIEAMTDYYRLAGKRFKIIINDITPQPSEFEQITGKTRNDKV